MILILNGAFGIGKTTVARRVVRRLPRAILFNPEFIGIPLQRAARLVGRDVHDFQDLSLWRTLTIVAIRVAHVLRPNVVVPMAFSNEEYLAQIRTRLTRFDPIVLHICLVAPVEVVHERLRSRGADPEKQSWEFRRASECCVAHQKAGFAEHIAATEPVDAVVEKVLAAVEGDATR